MHFTGLNFIKIGEHFSPDYPIHKQSAKFYLIKFKGNVYEICFFPLRVSNKI